jgi:hypothetical protein
MGDAIPRRMRHLLTAVLLALVLVFVQLLSSVMRDQGSDPSSQLSASTIGVAGEAAAFQVAGTVAALPACAEPAALAPGIDRCLVYTVLNPGPGAITVTSISVASVDAPVGCPASSLDLERAAYSGALAVPAGDTVSVTGPLIALRDTGQSQDGCNGATFTFTFTGTARSGVAGP